MIVEHLRTAERGDRVERSALVRWIGGEFRLAIEVPAGFEPPGDDATGFMLLALPLAMYRGEDLHVEAAVSPLALRSTERIQSIYAAWDPAAQRCRVRAAVELTPRAPADGAGCLFSRGVDSMYSAIAPDAKPLSHLVFCDTLTPDQPPDVREREAREVQTAAAVAGLPVLRISTNLRDPGMQLIDYQDLHGAGIAFVAHSLSGGLGRVVVPSGLTYSVAGPAGSHPLLDPLFASESLAFDHHGLDLGRPGKVERIAALAPGMLAHMKVCFDEDKAGNCGACRKCLWTMICLQAAGALELASLFPDEIDLDALRRQRIADLPLRLFWLQAAESLGSSPPEEALRKTIHHVLRRSARPSPTERLDSLRAWAAGRRPSPDPSWSQSSTAQFRNQTNAALAVLRNGVPYAYGIEAAAPQPAPAWSVGPRPADWRSPPETQPGLVGLVRLLDRSQRRNRYAVGPLPARPGLLRVAELGALRNEPFDGGVPVWVASDGRIMAASRSCSPRPRASVLARWTLAPLRWRGEAPLGTRVAESMARVRDASRAARRRTGGRACAGLHLEESEQSRPRGEPAGYLHGAPAAGLLPLFSALHPVTGDQLLCTDEREPAECGYCAPVLLGFLEAKAPASGTLAWTRPLMSWASHFGLAALDGVSAAP